MIEMFANWALKSVSSIQAWLSSIVCSTVLLCARVAGSKEVPAFRATPFSVVYVQFCKMWVVESTLFVLLDDTQVAVARSVSLAHVLQTPRL